MSGADDGELLVAVVPKNAREEIRLSVGPYGRVVTFKAWVFYRNEGGLMLPSNRGLAFSIDKLPEFTLAVGQTYQHARAQGLLE